MNKAKAINGGISASGVKRSFSVNTQTRTFNKVRSKENEVVALACVAPVTPSIDFRKIVEDAMSIHSKMVSQSKMNKTSGGRVIKPTGLFANRRS